MDDGFMASRCSSGFSRLKKPAVEDDIMELLWHHGQAVVQNQRALVKKNSGEVEKELEFNSDSTDMNLQMLHEDELASWIHCPIDDSALDHDLYADFLYTASPPPVAASVAIPKTTAAIPDMLNPPRLQNFANFSRVLSRPRAEAVPELSIRPAIEPTEVESNYTPEISLQVKDGGTTVKVAGEMDSSNCDLKLTSSPVISNTSFITSAETCLPDKRSPQPPEARKRKVREADDAQYRSEEGGGVDDAEARKQSQGSSSAKRSRSAQVHNLSERRRRDRINERMRALQELIPCCNKADKASMLDEAIEYMKSLQLQVQTMSMICGIVPVMYPGMPQMGMNIGMMGMNRQPLVPVSSPAMLQPIPGNMWPPRFGMMPLPLIHMQRAPLTEALSESMGSKNPRVAVEFCGIQQAPPPLE